MPAYVGAAHEAGGAALGLAAAWRKCCGWPLTLRLVPDVVLPCLDEALALPWVLGRMPAGYHPIVADNGSADGSAKLAETLAPSTRSGRVTVRVHRPVWRSCRR